MDLTHKANSVSVLPPRRFLPYFPQDWIRLLFGLYRALRLFLRRERHEGMYEILEFDSTLELVDLGGETAIFKRRQRVKFLQDNVIAFQDCAWEDGDIFADYRCSPGIEVDRYQEGDRGNVLISLRETNSTGDVEECGSSDESLQICIVRQAHLCRTIPTLPARAYRRVSIGTGRCRQNATSLSTYLRPVVPGTCSFK